MPTILFLGRVICSRRLSSHEKKKSSLIHHEKKTKIFVSHLWICFFLYFCCLKIAYFALWNYWCLPTYYKKKVCYQMCLWTIHAKIWFNSPPNQSRMSWNAEKSQFWLDKYLWAWFICSTTELYPKTIQWNVLGPLPPKVTPLPPKKTTTKKKYYKNRRDILFFVYRYSFS